MLSIFLNNYFHGVVRAPPFPLQCFHGNCFADNVEIIREDNDVKGLKLFLVAEGNNENTIIYMAN